MGLSNTGKHNILLYNDIDYLFNADLFQGSFPIYCGVRLAITDYWLGVASDNNIKTGAINIAICSLCCVSEVKCTWNVWNNNISILK